MGATVGNQNAADGKKWKAAIERALANKSASDGKQALDEIANVLIDKALAGEQWAIDQLGNRLDGKPAQSLDIGSDPQRPLLVDKVIREIVDPAKHPDA